MAGNNLKLTAGDLLKTSTEQLPTSEETTKETKEDVEQNKLIETDATLKVTEKSSEDKESSSMEIAKPDVNKTLESISSDILKEPIEIQNESLIEINKTMVVKSKENVETCDIKDTRQKSVDATNANDILPTEEIEPMDTCDSQESLNLIIDETSNITESKDDVSDNNKTDEDTNMEVELKEDDSSAIVKESDNKGQDEQNKQITDVNEEEKSEDADDSNKFKDDDVIPIEQPPVPIIEIDDEDDIDTTDSNQNLTKEGEQKQTPMDVDINTETISPTKEISATEKENDTNEGQSNDVKEKTEENLLEVTSEKPLEERVETQELNISENDGGLEDATVEIFYNRECINYECPRKHKQYLKVPQFGFSYFKVTKKKFKVQYICADCYDKALEMYEVS